MSAEDERAEIIERYRREIERLERSRDFGAVNRVRMALHRELREHEVEGTVEEIERAVALVERLRRLGIEVGHTEIQVPIAGEGDEDGD